MINTKNQFAMTAQDKSGLPLALEIKALAEERIKKIESSEEFKKRFKKESNKLKEICQEK